MPEQKYKISPWLILFAAFGVFWWFTGNHGERPLYNPDAKPRIVNACGDLPTDEKNTTDLFRAASPSVVYITDMELCRSLFNLNAYEITKGTGFALYGAGMAGL